MRRDKNVLLAAAIAAVLVPQAPVFAQGVLEEIIVTAERRATTEQTTAISMNVLTADDLAANRTQNIADLQQTTPNVTINNPGGFNSINIRGIGNSAIQPSINVGVAVFQDGLLNAETITLGNQFLDLGTAEVLRGPQGTFVGASSTGGAIRLNSVRPEIGGDTSGYVEALVGNYSDVKVTGAVNLPVSDTFAARIAYNQEKRSSYFYSRGTITGNDPVNPFQRPGSVNDMNARISLLWQPNDKFELIWRSEYNRSDNEGSPGQPNPRTFTLLSPAAGALQGTQANSRYWDYDGPSLRANATTPTAGQQGSVDPNHDPEVLSINLLDAQFVGIVDRHSVEWTYTFDNDIALRSLTGFVHNQNQYIQDGDGSFANAQVSRNDVGPDNNYYSQEFNLISPEGPFNWIAGASWFYRMTPVNNITETYNCGIDPARGTFTPCQTQFTSVLPGFSIANTETTVRSGGLFGQINWEFVPDLELTAGFRWNIDKNFSQGRDRPQGVVTVNPTGGAGNCPADVRGIPRYNGMINWNVASCGLVGGASSYEEETPTWKVGLNWTPGDNNFVYLFWAKGYKAGGVDNQGRFEAEEVDDYELGWKGTFADGRAQLSIGAFYMDYGNMQQSAFRASNTTAGNTVFNVGESTIQGIEAEFNAKLGGFGLQANVGWVDSEIGDVSLIDRTLVSDADVRAPGTTADLRQCNAGEAQLLAVGGCVDWTPYYRNISGVRNVYSSDLQYSVSIDYEILAGNGTWTPKATYSFTGDQDVNLIRREDFWLIEERSLLNLSLTYQQDDWLVQAYCANCSDETYIGNIGSGGGMDNNSVVYGAPMTFGVRFRRTF